MAEGGRASPSRSRSRRSRRHPPLRFDAGGSRLGPADILSQQPRSLRVRGPSTRTYPTPRISACA
ncbi:MAG: hypothetical protein M0C28_14935 [Candidatus Moduliflexus flocculans]|nr:hypothetical protein [Candidatus Moduliflexus flocculans]